MRYLDLRIAHMTGGSERNLHFVHMIYTTALVEVGSWGVTEGAWGGCTGEGWEGKGLGDGEEDRGKSGKGVWVRREWWDGGKGGRD